MQLTRLVLLAAAVGALACSDDPSGPSGGHSTTISVRDNFFNPSPDTVPTGQVTFSWAGAIGHNVTWDTGPSSPAASGTMTTGTHQVTLQAGTYTYHCSLHGTAGTGMHGTIVVQ